VTAGEAGGVLQPLPKPTAPARVEITFEYTFNEFREGLTAGWLPGGFPVASSSATPAQPAPPAPAA
jgi:hypothetical protein